MFTEKFSIFRHYFPSTFTLYLTMDNFNGYQINKAREQKNLGNIPRLKFKNKIYESDFDKCMLFSQILKGIFNDELDIILIKNINLE